MFFTRPRVFDQTPCFPHPLFSTRPRVFNTQGPRTPGPRPRVFHLAGKNRRRRHKKPSPLSKGFFQTAVSFKPYTTHSGDIYLRVTFLRSFPVYVFLKPTNYLQARFIRGISAVSNAIAKRTKSKNRMQITEFPARLSQHKRVLREIQRM